MSGVKRYMALGPMFEPDELMVGGYVLASDYDQLAAELATVKKVAYGNLELMGERDQLKSELDAEIQRRFDGNEMSSKERNTLHAANQRLRAALVKAEAMLAELDYVGEMTELGKAHLVEIRAALSTNGEVTE